MSAWRDLAAPLGKARADPPAGDADHALSAVSPAGVSPTCASPTGAADKLTLLLLLLLLLLLVLSLAALWLNGQNGRMANSSVDAASIDAASQQSPWKGALWHLGMAVAAATPSPFLPAANTSTPPATATPAAPGWLALDLADEAAPLRVLLPALDREPPLTVEFRPGWPCAFDDHRACISRHLDGQVLLVTIHSGVGGEAQALRDAVEGTGINRAGHSLERITANLRALRDAPLTIQQDAAQVEDLRVLAALRVPPARLEAYYSQPFAAALAAEADAAAAEDPELRSALADGRPLLVIETCGWRHPAEPWYPGVTDTTGAVYLFVIGQ